MKDFRPVQLPDDTTKYIPDDILLRFPVRAKDAATGIQLVEIPWDNMYWQKFPAEFRDYWEAAFPYMHVRTTDVHTALCLGMMDEFLKMFPLNSYDRLVVGVGIIFHDVGWSQLSEDQIAMSVGVKGITLPKGALDPNQAHMKEGAEIVKKELSAFNELTPEQKQAIIEIVSFHDILDRSNYQAMNFKITCDLDALWLFTHESFWQETVQRNSEPHEYWSILEKEIATRFLTEQGKKMARRMLSERRDELRWYEKRG
jgi:hypothetical protein